MNVLVLNGGSSSLKAQLHQLAGAPLPATPPPSTWKARAEWGRDTGKAEIRIGGDEGRTVEIGAQSEVLKPVLESLHGIRVDVVGHRVVHGGKYHESTRIDAEVKAEIRRVAELAPEHNSFEADAIDAVERLLGPETAQIAVFDTAFHSTLAEAAYVYPGPYSWLERGIRRFGFHGISHRYVSERASKIVGRPLEELKMITCHLGNGCSLAAIDGGKSIDTTMGFTPLDGLMMGTRSGSLDPGILIYLQRHCGSSADELERVLNEESGLKGVSGISGDMRTIEHEMERGNERARLAFDVYVHRLVREIGAMAASLDGVDVLVFTGGIGENSVAVREGASRKLSFFGVEIDAERNASKPLNADIATATSRVRVLVIQTEEDWAIARECHRMMTR